MNSWVASDHGERIFFADFPYLPQNCPPHLLALRQQDLDSLRVSGAEMEAMNRNICFLLWATAADEEPGTKTASISYTCPLPCHPMPSCTNQAPHRW